MFDIKDNIIRVVGIGIDIGIDYYCLRYGCCC